MPELYKKALKKAVKEIESRDPEQISLFHHNDTDGLSSGAILETALGRHGFSVSRFSLEKPYPKVLEKVFEASEKVIILADFAGMITPIISEMNRKRNLVIILDHHPAVKSEDSSVINLDPDLFGFRGDRDVSASAVCFLFAEELDSRNRDLAHLGTLGAIGDGFFVNGALSGINRMVMEKALENGSIRIIRKNTVRKSGKNLINGKNGSGKNDGGTITGNEGQGEGEDYLIKLGGKELPAERVCASLDTIGGAGYYSGGPDKGVSICLEGFNPDQLKLAEELKKKKEVVFNKETERLKKGGLRTTDHIKWFDVEDRFAPMGVKMIGVFCNIIRNTGLVDGTKYLAGFQKLPDEVPGFGRIEFNSKKISMRVSGHLTEKIRNKEVPGLDSFLPQATLNLGGFADACHSLAAATTVETGLEKKLILEMEKILSRVLK